MTTLLTPDICVIGAGSGGLSVAAGAAAFGVPVVLVEKGRMGGDCLNFGCVPSKALIAAGRHAHSMRHGSGFGIADVKPEIDFAGVSDHVGRTIAAIAPNDSVERFTALGVRVVQATARFEDPRTVVAGDIRIRARRFVVATGSKPIVPAIPGIEAVRFLTNETIFALKRRPGHLAILGAGPVGVELAQAYRRLGARVTLIDSGSALSREDPEFARTVLNAMRAEGVVIREGTSVTEVEPIGRAGVRLHVTGPGGMEPIDATHFLVATGRKPGIDDLGLEEARIAHDRNGIRVSAGLRTTNSRVYAIGDVVGAPQFTHRAGNHAALVLRALLFRLRASENRFLLPRVTFTDPEIAQVGMTEAEAMSRHSGVRILRWPYAENDRAQAERRTAGFVKVVTTRRGTLLGVGIVGHEAGEIINLYALALTKEMNVRDIAGYVAPYPTMAEIGKRASVSYFTGATRKPFVRWLVRQLRRLG